MKTPSEPEFERSAQLLRVLGHAVRLTLLSAIVDGERAVGEIEELAGVTQPMLSQQLGVLRKAQLVETRRESKQIFYRLNNERIYEVSALIDRLAGIERDTGRSAKVPRATSTGSAAMFARMSD